MKKSNRPDTAWGPGLRPGVTLDAGVDVALRGSAPRTEPGRSPGNATSGSTDVARVRSPAPHLKDAIYSQARSVIGRSGTIALIVRYNPYSVNMRNEARAAEARDLLARVYVWFTRSFDTRDLKDAPPRLEEVGT